jgi:hypothetical protein
MEKEPIKDNPKEPIRKESIRLITLADAKNKSDVEQEIISNINYGIKLSKEFNFDVKKASKEIYPNLTKVMAMLSYGDLVGASDEITNLSTEVLPQDIKDKYIPLLNINLKPPVNYGL